MTRDGKRRLLRSVAVVSVFTLGTQAVVFATQLVIAHLFGAGGEMDAYLAAVTLPSFAIVVILASLGFVFVPVFVQYASEGRDEDAWKVASSVINLVLIAFAVITVVGILFADELLALTAPGLSEESRELAAQIALLSWPTVITTAAATLLASIEQAQERFGLPAAAPFVGALVTLAGVVALSSRFGVVGVAVATLVGLGVQVALLWPSSARAGYRLTIALGHPGVRRVLHLLWPLVLSSVLVRCTPLVERYLASEMGEGSISVLGYAYKLVSVLAVLLNTGISTVAFPRMAARAAEQDMPALAGTVAKGLKLMWLVSAPVIAIGAVLALPAITVLLQHGEFTASAAIAVAAVLQIYLLGLAASCLSSVTRRAFYALGHTRSLAIIGSAGAIGYVGYTVILTHHLGAAGIALGYAIYANLSLVWELAVLRLRTGGAGKGVTLRSFAITGVAAAVAAGVAWLVQRTSSYALVQLLAGGLLGLLAYYVTLRLLRSPEVVELVSLVRRSAPDRGSPRAGAPAPRG